MLTGQQVYASLYSYDQSVGVLKTVCVLRVWRDSVHMYKQCRRSRTEKARQVCMYTAKLYAGMCLSSFNIIVVRYLLILITRDSLPRRCGMYHSSSCVIRITPVHIFDVKIDKFLQSRVWSTYHLNFWWVLDSTRAHYDSSRYVVCFALLRCLCSSNISAGVGRCGCCCSDGWIVVLVQSLFPPKRALHSSPYTSRHACWALYEQIAP